MLDCKWTVLLIIIISFLYFHSFLYRLSSWYLQLKTYDPIVTLNRCEIGLLFTQITGAATNFSYFRCNFSHSESRGRNLAKLTRVSSHEIMFRTLDVHLYLLSIISSLQWVHYTETDHLIGSLLGNCCCGSLSWIFQW